MNTLPRTTRRNMLRNHIPLASAVSAALALAACGGGGGTSDTPPTPPAEVPEPTSWLLLGGGIAALAGYAWRHGQRR